MRPIMPIIALLSLAACANGGSLGQTGGLSGFDAAVAALRDGAPQAALRIDDAILAKDPRNIAALLNRGDAQNRVAAASPGRGGI